MFPSYDQVFQNSQSHSDLRPPHAHCLTQILPLYTCQQHQYQKSIILPAVYVIIFFISASQNTHADKSSHKQVRLNTVSFPSDATLSNFRPVSFCPLCRKMSPGHLAKSVQTPSMEKPRGRRWGLWIRRWLLTWADMLSKKALLYLSERECVVGVYHLREELIRGERASR